MNTAVIQGSDVAFHVAPTSTYAATVVPTISANTNNITPVLVSGEKGTKVSFLSGIKVFGTDIEKAFSWFGSSNGKVVVAAGESVVEAVDPASSPIVALFNTWAQKAYTVESLAAAAGKATGTGVEKAALVATAIAPDVLTYAQQAGVPTRTATQIAAANSAVVSFINALTQ